MGISNFAKTFMEKMDFEEGLGRNEVLSCRHSRGRSRQMLVVYTCITVFPHIIILRPRLHNWGCSSYHGNGQNVLRATEALLFNLWSHLAILIDPVFT